MVDMAVVRRAWQVGETLKADKETVYPEHSKVQDFDKIRRKNVLEYGCGAGSDSVSYLRRGNSVTYCDVVPENVQATARRIEASGFTIDSRGVTLENTTPLPFLEHVFDVVNCHGVLHHIEDPVPLLREFYRVTKPDAVLYIMAYTEHLRQRSDKMVTTLMANGLSEAEAFGEATDGHVPYARAYSSHEMLSLLESLNFRVTKMVEYNNRDFRTYTVKKAQPQKPRPEPDE